MQFKITLPPWRAFCRYAFRFVNSEIRIIFGNKLFPSFHPTVSSLNDLWWAINYSGNAAEEQRKTKIETVNVNMQGAEEAGDSISRRLGWWCVRAERIQVDTSWDAEEKQLWAQLFHITCTTTLTLTGWRAGWQTDAGHTVVWVEAGALRFVSLADDQPTVKRPEYICNLVGSESSERRRWVSGFTCQQSGRRAHHPCL